MKKLLLMILPIFGFSTVASAQNFTCGKRLCKQMTSCAEARYHLTQCRVDSLDRDNDGIPCETICLGKTKKNKKKK